MPLKRENTHLKLMTTRTEKIEVALTPAEKNELKDWVEGTPDYSSMAMMLRTLAKKEMADDDGEQPTASIDEDTVEQAVGNALTPLETRLERIEDTIADLDAQAGAANDELRELANTVYEELPVLDSPEEFDSFHEILSDEIGMDPNHETTRQDEITYARRASTVSSWATFLDIETTRARKVLANMVEWFPEVEFAYADPTDDDRYEIDSETRRYYRTA